MQFRPILRVSILLSLALLRTVVSADERELRSLHGTMITTSGPTSGMAMEIWAKGDFVRSEYRAGSANVITIQRGPKLYTFGESGGAGMVFNLGHGLGTLGLIKQIEEIKARGSRQGAAEIEGELYDVYQYDVNAPEEMALIYLSRESSLPKLWISVVQAEGDTAEALRIVYRDMEANVDIPDHYFHLPKNVTFAEQESEVAEGDEQQTPQDSHPSLDNAVEKSNLFVVISRSAQVMAGKEVLGTIGIGEIVKISRRKGDWLFTSKPISGWLKSSDLVPIEQSLEYFRDAVRRDPQDPDILLGYGNLTLRTAQYLSDKSERVGEDELITLLKVARSYLTQSALLRPGAEALIKRGVVRSIQGDSSGAIGDFSRALEIEPSNIQAIQHRALEFIDSDKLDEAIGDCDQILKMDSTNAQAHSLRCFALGLQNKWDDAMLSCNTAIEIEPQLALAYLRRGRIWAGKGDDIRAKEDYDEAIRLGENLARAFRARIFYQQGQVQPAIDDLSALIELQPQNPDFWFQRGALLAEINQSDSALRDLSRSIELRPTSAAYLNRGAIWAAKNEISKAMEDFNAAIELASEEPDAYRLRARLYRQLQQYQAAADDLTEYLRLVPNDLSGYVRRGLNYYFSKDYQNALRDFDYAVAHLPNDPNLFVYRGSVFNALKEYDRAVQDFTRAIELDPRSAEAFAYRGVSWNALEHKDKALSDFNEAIRLNPNFEVAYVNRGSYWRSISENDKSLRDFREASRLNPNRASVLNEVASILATAPENQLRNGQEAVDLATLACEITGWEMAEYLSTLAAAYAELGDFESAIEWQKKSMELMSEDSRESAHERLDRFLKGLPIRSEP